MQFPHYFTRKIGIFITLLLIPMLYIVWKSNSGTMFGNVVFCVIALECALFMGQIYTYRNRKAVFTLLSLPSALIMLAWYILV
jgi:hypothetical protein